MGIRRQTTFVATLGGQPQVISFAIDALLARGVRLDKALLIHLGMNAPRLQTAVQKITATLSEPHYNNIKLAFHPIAHNGDPVADIRDEADAHATWEAISQLLIELKNEQHTLHVCISGGRQMLGFMTMSAAMLHFGHEDRLWHSYTPDEWLSPTRDGGMMHLPPDAGFQLIEVPMMPWGSYFPALRQLTRPVTSETDVLAGPRRLLDDLEEMKQTAVHQQLTPRQNEVLEAFANGLTPKQVAEKLFISLKTVNSHKTVILAECRNAWAMPETAWLDYRFIAEKFMDVEE
ncbi:CRISPR-associated ring nuclease [Candidatus Leptofilum sp.]|uniref:CRISPR-associated ring nuclease n=1 Tax=Candidatus Leptofilum sp. TaxID=3241576 RepID=UPI003B5B0BEB